MSSPDWGQYDIPFDAWSRFSEFHGCWRASRRSEQSLPTKQALDPGCLGSLVNEFALLERRTDGEFFFRLIAAGLIPLGHHDLTGRALTSLLTPSLAERVRTTFARAGEARCGAYHDLTVTFASGHRVEVDALYLPYLRHAEDQHPEFYGVIFHLSDPGDRLVAATSKPVRYDMGDLVFIDLGFGYPLPGVEFMSGEGQTTPLPQLRAVT